MKTGKYRPSDLYPTPTDPHVKSEYEDYLRKRLACAGKRSTGLNLVRRAAGCAPGLRTRRFPNG